MNNINNMRDKLGRFLKGYDKCRGPPFSKGNRLWKIRKHSPEGLKKLSEHMKLLRKTKIKGMKTRTSFTSERIKKLLENKEFREKRIKNTLKSLIKRPTSLEKKYIELFKKYNLPFAYCGNGILIIGFKNPDFYEINGRKVCIEVRSKCFTIMFKKMNPEEWAKNRIEHFAKYGWKCLVFFEDDLKNEEGIVKKIKEVL
jgi:hypothetical protein